MATDLERRISAGHKFKKCAERNHPYEQIAITQYDSDSRSLIVMCTGCKEIYKIVLEKRAA